MKTTVAALTLCVLCASAVSSSCKADELKAGFAEADITPVLGDKPVYMAGFGQNRKAAKVHDPLMARCVVLRHDGRRIALVSVDLVGFFYPDVLRVRERLEGFTYVLISSTHNHEGPDTLGLWGPNPFVNGIDPAYMTRVVEQIVKAVREADAAAVAVTAKLGTAKGPELLHDGRLPPVKHDDLVALDFEDTKAGKRAGLVVQWNCHPETLGGKNTELSADYVGYTVGHLRERYRCPVVYLTGTVGGLMTSLHVPIKDDKGELLADGTFAKTERYGRLLGDLAVRALADARPVTLTPLAVHRREFFVPLDNPLYQKARQIGVLKREAFLWTGDPYNAKPAGKEGDGRFCLKTETAWLRLGQLDVAAIPGEIYPELVLGQVQDPADPAADFPEAPAEPAVYPQLPGPYRMIVGLANDEIGYIIPKRQWDEKPPFCYGRQKSQYGEVNSVGPETAPTLCRVFRQLVAGAGQE